MRTRTIKQSRTSLMTCDNPRYGVRFTRCNVRDHIELHKSDRRRSYRFYRALQRLRSPTFDTREIFGASRFLTFSTVSAQSGPSPKRGWCPITEFRSIILNPSRTNSTRSSGCAPVEGLTHRSAAREGRAGRWPSGSPVPDAAATAKDDSISVWASGSRKDHDLALAA